MNQLESKILMNELHVKLQLIMKGSNWWVKHCTRSGTGSYGRQMAVRWQSDKIHVNLEILKITVHRKIRLLLRLTKVQHHYSSRNAFQVFSGKIYCKACFLKCKNT